MEFLVDNWSKKKNAEADLRKLADKMLEDSKGRPADPELMKIYAATVNMADKISQNIKNSQKAAMKILSELLVDRAWNW
jgi:hypothetical protein